MAISIDQALAHCLENIKDKGSSIEDCVVQYPEHEEELVDMLELVLVLNELGNISSRPQFRENSTERLVSRLADRNTAYSEKTRPIKRQKQFKLRWSFNVLRFAILGVLLLITLTGGTAFAADNAGPGDFLYDLDLAIEQIQLDLTTDVSQTAELRMNFAAERLLEAESKLNNGDIDHGNAALEAYEQEMTLLSDLIASQVGVEKEKLTALVETASSRNQEVLETLLLSAPDPGKVGIQRAIDASTKIKEKQPQGPPEDVQQGPPEDKSIGPPEDKNTGKPEDKAKGKPDKDKKPTGKP
jgi:hypothetical protein